MVKNIHEFEMEQMFGDICPRCKQPNKSEWQECEECIERVYPET